MTPLHLQQATIDAYAQIRSALLEGPAHPIRFWNFIPDVNRKVDRHLDRYMVFNAGRHAAYTAWHGEGMERDQRIVTASGVGHHGDDLVIHCLAADRPGAPIENPRQTPAYRYSPRFGPYPPGFARATLLRGLPFTGDHADSLLIGGTASIRGEHSLHSDLPDAQVHETLVNLAAVIRCAESGNGAAHVRAGAKMQMQLTEMDEAIDRIRAWRIYYVRPDHREALESALTPHLGGAEEVEWVHADLCRPELLVEIEAVAGIPCAVSTPREAMKPHHV